MTTWVEGTVDGLESELVVRFLAKKGWSEKNFQVGHHVIPVPVSLRLTKARFDRCLQSCTESWISLPSNVRLSVDRQQLFAFLISVRSWVI
jgi:hypothetical protein